MSTLSLMPRQINLFRRKGSRLDEAAAIS
jgi:hypothetical protein